MFDDLILVHRRGAESFRTSGTGWCLWQTCLRKIAIGPVEALSDIELLVDDEIMRGSEAFRFCLEVACGLHSPLVGETEVFGQFKIATESWLSVLSLTDGLFASELKRFVRSIIEDAKKVRSAHLSDLGSQSYGSLLRKELKGVKEIHVLGGGHLAGEILPWICKDGNSVHVHVRNLTRASDLREKFPNVTFHEISEHAPMPLGGALVVAAPVTAVWLTTWLQPENAKLKRIADLRSDSETDLITEDTSLIGLGELMRRISANQEVLQERRRLALDVISNIVVARARHVEYRPFGWEDVCA